MKRKSEEKPPSPSEKHAREEAKLVPPAQSFPWYLEPDLEMSKLANEVDWASTAIGPMENWPMSFKTGLSICLASRFPMVLWLGQELLVIYNDSYKPLMGAKHPKSLGRPGRECWPEIWNTIGPMLSSVMTTGKATWMDDLLLVMNRHGFLEETYWTFSYSPIRSSSNCVDGVFTAVEETSARCISERRLRTLRDLSVRTSPTGTDHADAVIHTCKDVVNTLSMNPHDAPLVALYRVNTEQRHLFLEHCSGIRAGIPGISPDSISMDAYSNDYADALCQAAARVQRYGKFQELALSPSVMAAIGVLPPWNDTPRSVIILPLTSKASSNQGVGLTGGIPLTLSSESATPNNSNSNINSSTHLKSAEADLGVLVLGLNTHQALNENYITFLNLVASQVSSSLVAARAYQQERKRAEALAELDRAKTTFFSNISHEFRTPLTLMIGPLEGIIQSGHLPDAERDQLSLVYRNSLRLLKLVNVLLDFSRIEAGRMQAVFQPLDLSLFTAELASVFRSACEKADLELIVDCQPLPERVYVDADMWEKIVLNLLSNAYKYTLSGKIEVRLRAVENAAELSVCDSGCGIPKEEMPRLFERFHRIQSSKGRTHEGTGIGLALVYELVRLHGGSIRAESNEGNGTSFHVTIPFGRAHLPADHVVQRRSFSADSDSIETQQRMASHLRNLEWWVQTPAMDSAHFLQEPSSHHPRVMTSSQTVERVPHVMVVEDNADMQQYVCRILSEHYQVSQASNGLDALTKLQSAMGESLPDLVLSDVMMPHLDGFGLLKAIRGDERLRDLPMIFLSAQAGEEARSEGIAAGADDYLVKPFSAKELLTRVSARLELARVRAAASKKEQQLREEAERANKLKDHFLAVLSHELRNPLLPVLLVAEALQTDQALPQRIRDDLTIIVRNVQLEVQLINDLLDVTKISQQKLTFELHRVDAHEMLQYTLRNFTQNFQEKNLHVTLKLDAADHHMMADSARLQQIYWNLIGNAVKFTPEEGSITLRSRNATCESGNGKILLIEVADSGVGIEPQVLPKLFNAFEQGGETVNRRFGGLGLGLSIAKALANMHGGGLTAASEGRNRGATFTLTLPVMDSPLKASSSSLSTSSARRNSLLSSQPTQPQEKALMAAGSLRILLIEDNPTNLMVMERMLSTRLGHRVVTANSFESAVQILKSTREPFDRVVCDLGLPDGNGLDLMPHIIATHPNARAIALTGYGTDGDVMRSKEAGFVLHLTKPVSLAQLEQALADPT